MGHTVPRPNPIAQHPMDKFIGKSCLACDEGAYYILERPLADGAAGGCWGPTEKWGIESDNDGLLRCKKCGDIQRFLNPGKTIAEGTSATTGIAWSK